MKRHPFQVIALGVLLAFPVVAAVATPVAADCGDDGIRWPASPADVHGVTFIATAVEDVVDAAEPGTSSVRFSVERVVDGELGQEVVVTPWCVTGAFEAGVRYLISTTDTLPLPGADASPGDDHLWFTDGSSVAWRLEDDGAAHLVGYGGASLRDAPLVLRRAVSLDQALAWLRPDPASPVPGNIGESDDDAFRLTITTDRATYTTEEAIPVAATLAYLGRDPITAGGSGSGLVQFQVRQIDGPFVAGGGWTADCVPYPFAPGDVMWVGFTKTGGYEADGPDAAFWIGWFNRAHLVLPAGRYRIIAMAEYYRETPGQNGFRELCGDQHELAAEVVVDVVEPASSAAPSAPPTLAPSVTPVSAAPEVVLDANLRALVVGGSSGP